MVCAFYEGNYSCFRTLQVGWLGYVGTSPPREAVHDEPSKNKHTPQRTQPLRVTLIPCCLLAQFIQVKGYGRPRAASNPACCATLL